MTTDVDIVNAGLIKLGEATITTLADDVKAARLANAIFADQRDVVLRAHPWNFAMARAELTVGLESRSPVAQRRGSQVSVQLWRVGEAQQSLAHGPTLQRERFDDAHAILEGLTKALPENRAGYERLGDLCKAAGCGGAADACP